MALELAFETKALRDMCESEAIAKRKLGAKVADALWRRLSDFRSIDSFDELPFAKSNKNSNSITFDLSDDWQLVVTGGHGDNPKLASGKTDWTKVTRLKVTRIEKCK
jgi:toxin HigB-1